MRKMLLLALLALGVTTVVDLRTAAAGHVGEHLHAAVSSLVCGDVIAAIAAARIVTPLPMTSSRGSKATAA